MTAATTTRRRSSPPPHGDDRRYTTHRCRCPACRDGHRVAAARRRRLIAYGRWNGLIDATGTIRRLRSLCRIGHHAVRVAAELNVDPSWIRALTRGDHDRVQATTAARIAAVYDRLADTPAPPGIGTTRVRRWAESLGWPHPDAWAGVDIDDPAAEPVVGDGVDEVALEQVLAGNTRFTALHDADRTALVARLTGQGLTVGQICYRLGVSESSVVGYLPETHPTARSRAA